MIRIKNRLKSILPDGAVYEIYKIKNKIKVFVLKHKNIDELKEELSKQYVEATGKELCWTNLCTFNEKMQWIKLFDISDKKTQCADKFAVREYVKKCIGGGYLIPLIGKYNSFSEINFDELPKEFVIKCNHDSGSTLIVNEKDEIDIKDLNSRYRQLLSRNFGWTMLELQYKDIPPCILIEEKLNLSDYHEYQFYCFNGVPRFISVIDSPHGINKKLTYDTQWNKLPFVTSLPMMEGDIERPDCLDKLISLVEMLSKDFKFVRVDMYYKNPNSIFFSEMTFTPACGMIHWNPPEYDLVWGKYLNIE